MEKDFFERIINEYGKDIYSFCVYLSGSRHEADDLYQQVFLIAMEKNDIDESNNPKSYLLSIAANTWNNRKRKILWRREKAEIVHYEKDSLEQVAGESNTPEDEFIKREELIRVRKLVNELPDKMKVVILLYYMEEMSIEEISNTLNIPIGTVKSRLHQSKKKLKERLSANEGQNGYSFEECI